MFIQGHLAAAIIGTFAAVGWIVQGAGNAFFYRQVRVPCHIFRPFDLKVSLCRYGPIARPPVILSIRFVIGHIRPVHLTQFDFVGEDRTSFTRRKGVLHERMKTYIIMTTCSSCHTHAVTLGLCLTP